MKLPFATNPAFYPDNTKAFLPGVDGYVTYLTGYTLSISANPLPSAGADFRISGLADNTKHDLDIVNLLGGGSINNYSGYIDSYIQKITQVGIPVIYERSFGDTGVAAGGIGSSFPITFSISADSGDAYSASLSCWGYLLPAKIVTE